MVPVLQVKVGQELLDGFKERAGRQRLTMTELVVGWIEGYLSGGEGQAGGGSASSSGTSGTTSGSNDSEQYAALAARVSALEQALIALQGTSTTPHGGTSARRVSESASGGASRDSGFEVVDRGNPFGGAPREASVPEPARAWMALPKGEPDLAAIAPLAAGRKLYLEDGWVSFRSPVAVTVKLADGTVLAASATGWTGAEVEITAPGGGWPGGEGNRGLKDVSAPVDAVEFLSPPELKEAAE